ncbi:ATP-binding protein [Cupriavidus necator]|uniref:hybrid sensor histidine kinase/response regulator n=1 Tax=Cupriavidus necator TaxID=106590 RepID=UPI00339D54A7
MQPATERTPQTLASAFDALAGNARRQQHLCSVTIAVLSAIVLFSGLLLAGLAAERHLDYRRSYMAQYVASISQLLQNESSFLRRTVLAIRDDLDTPAPDPSRDADLAGFRRAGAASGQVEAVRKDYHLLAADATRHGWGTSLPKQFMRLRHIALATVATQQAFDLDHGAYAVSLNEDSAIVISQPEAGARAPMALDPTLIPLLRTRLTDALLDRTGHAVPARDEQVWMGPLRHPVDDSPIVVLARAAYVGDTPTMLVAACVPVQAFLAELQRPREPALLALLNEADEIIDISPSDNPASAAIVRDMAARARELSPNRLHYTRTGVQFVQPLQAGFGLLVYHLPYRILGAALAAELAVIGSAMLLLIGAIVLSARYWNRHLLRRTHSEASRADRTAREALQEQLRSAQEATEAMLRARATFFAAMSHEIRTPLNALLGNLELLSRSSGLEAHAPRLRALDTAAQALRRIVNDVLDFSKIDAGKLRLVDEPFRPIDALESLALTYAPMVAGRAIRFHLHLSPSLDAEVTGDCTRLVQVINNLLNNAFKFTASGRIAVSAGLRHDEHGTQRLVCRVSDSGIGMPPSLVARVFQPFVQGDAVTGSRYGGTGLGLSICARLCELMGGSITVDSVPDVGSAFTVSVPLRVPLTPAAQQAPAQAATAPRGQAMVLCQDARDGEHLEAWLNAAGWRTNVLLSLAAAQEALRFKAPDVIVATGEYALAALAGLRDAAPVPMVWVTPEGPHRPCQRATGILEVTEFSHRALLDGMALAADGAAPMLAACPGDAVPQGDAPPVTPALAASALTILVAEDNPLNQTLITEQLQTLGCQPIVAGNGKLALAVLETTRVDAVLTDIHMPVMDGHQLLAQVHAQHPGLPVLAFSALTSSESSENWRQRGFAGYVAKPASLQDLQACLCGLPGPKDGGDAAAAAAGNDTEDTDQTDPAHDSAYRRRYEAMLRNQLAHDLPGLARIIKHCDPAALQAWVHSAAGAFMIVQHQSIVSECRALEALCTTAGDWTPAVAAAANALHARLRDYARGEPDEMEAG